MKKRETNYKSYDDWFFTVDFIEDNVTVDNLKAMFKVNKVKQIDNHGLTDNKFEPFWCYTVKFTKGCGVSKSTSGGKYNTKIYLKVGGSDKNTKYQAHKLSILTTMGFSYESLVSQKGLDVSHRCHNRLCWRSSHMVIELHPYNMSRNRCPGWVITSTQVIKLCNHTPCCLHVTLGEVKIFDIKNFI